MDKIEPTGVKKGDVDIIGFIQKRYDAKQIEYSKRECIRTYLSKYMAALLGSERDTNTGRQGENANDVQGNFKPKNAQLYTSAFMTKAFEIVQSSKNFADAVDFEPDQGGMPEKEILKAQNVSHLVSYSNINGDIDTMKKECKKDLAFGECFYTQEYEKDMEGKNTKLKKKALLWENVRPFYGDTDLIVIERLTVGQFVVNYGEPMLEKVAYGDPLSVQDKMETPTLDESSILDKEKTIGVVKYWDYALKRHYVLLGGNAFMEKDMQQEGGKYFWVNSDKEGFCPVKSRVYRQPFRGYHGYGVLDLLYPLAYLETVIVNSTAHASVLAADPMLIFYADDIADIRQKWNQYLANKSRGSHSSPFFVQQGKKNPIQHDQVSFDPNINIFSVWREFVINEATTRTGMDFNVLTVESKTAEQQNLRKREVEKESRTVMQINADVDRDFAMETIYILKAGESKFHDKDLYIEVNEEYYQDATEEEIEQMKNKSGTFDRVPVNIREFLKEVEQIEYKVTPRLDGILDDQTFDELQSARADILLLPDGTKAKTKLSEFIFKKSYGGISFVTDDFSVPLPEVAPQL